MVSEDFISVEASKKRLEGGRETLRYSSAGLGYIVFKFTNDEL